jgi:hypothetical protein
MNGDRHTTDPHLFLGQMQSEEDGYGDNGHFY